MSICLSTCMSLSLVLGVCACACVRACVCVCLCECVCFVIIKLDLHIICDVFNKQERDALVDTGTSTAADSVVSAFRIPSLLWLIQRY